MFTFRPLAAHDFELLVLWRNHPHVAEWWDGPTDLAGITAQYTPRLSPLDPVRMFIVERDGGPFGRIQYERTKDWLPGYDADVANIDFLIGDAGDIGRGHGPQMIAQFIQDMVLEDGRFSRVVADPAIENQRSIRALEKAGFRKGETRLLEGQLHQIMEWSIEDAD